MISEERKRFIENLAKENFEKEKYYHKIKNKLKEKELKAKRIHLKEISTRYKEAKNNIYLKFLKENNLQEWKDSQHGHSLVIPEIKEGDSYYESIKVLQNKDTFKGTKLKENAMTASEMLKQTREQNLSLSDMLEKPLIEIEDLINKES